MRRAGGLIIASRGETDEEQSQPGVWDTFDAYDKKRKGFWPTPKSIDTFADANSKTTFTEGEGLTINIATTGYLEGENFYWKITSSAGSNAADTNRDVGQPIQGFVPIDASGNATLYISTMRDGDNYPPYPGFPGETVTVSPTDSSYNILSGAPTVSYSPVTEETDYAQNKAVEAYYGGVNARSNTKNKFTYARVFPNYGHPSGSNTSVSGYAWSDWGDDIFDTWGNWHFYHDTHGVGEMNASTPAEATWSSNFDTGSPSSNLGSMTNYVTEGNDGTINTCYMLIDFTGTTSNQSLKRIVKFRYGYLAAGIYMMDFSWAYSWAMRVVMGGNMGSDSNTNNFDQSGSYNRYGNTNALTFYGNFNYQTNSTYEKFSTYWRPHLDADNAALVKGISGDNLYLWTPNVSNGCTFWFAKGTWNTYASVLSYMNTLVTDYTQLN